MPDNVETPTDKLRQRLLEKAKSGSQKKEGWSPQEKAHATANGMPWIYGFFDMIDTGDQKAGSILEGYAADNGFNSLQELRGSLDGLRDQLRDELPPDAWNKYFNHG